MLRLPQDLEEQLWSEIQTYETVEHMPYVTSVERIGIRKGIQQGLQRERLLLLRQTRKRFGAAVAEQSTPPCSIGSTTPRQWKTSPRPSSTVPTEQPGCKP